MNRDHDGQIAIVGMACVYAGAANLRQYWRNIINGVDAIGPLPEGRWAGSQHHDYPADHGSHLQTQRGGFIPTPYRFDPMRYKVMPNVARHGDADQFVLLDTVADALADAGIADEAEVRHRTDLIVGRGGYASSKTVELFMRVEGIERTLEFLRQSGGVIDERTQQQLSQQMRATLGPLHVDALASCIPNFAASRAANRLDLGGAAYVVDAACASSLLAIEQAIHRLREGRSDLAVAAGCNFTHQPSFWHLFENLRAMSPTGCIRPFDADADGLLIGEGAGAVVLKRVEDARRDGDRVYAVIRGAGSASDGRATEMLAPAMDGQLRALAAAYEEADVAPETVGLLEAHGTGTPLGDGTELATIREFFGPPSGRYASRAMGSVKSMIGHTMPAAGVASVIKVALALSNKLLPPSLHCDKPRDELADIAFYVNTTARPWTHDPHDPPRRAAVNAFGFGGINAHAVLEEVPVPAASRTSVLMPRAIRPDLDRPTELLAWAADSPGHLAQRIRRTARFLAEDQTDAELEDIACALAHEATDADGDGPSNADADVATHADARSHRLAVVMGPDEATAQRLEQLADEVEAGRLKTEDHRGVYVGRDRGLADAKVAAIFPGIGFPGIYGEHPVHMLIMAMHDPRLRQVLDLVERRDRHPDDPLPTSLALVPPEHLAQDDKRQLARRFTTLLDQQPSAEADEKPPAPDERVLAAVGLLVSNWMAWQLLQRHRVAVDAVCGQSLGDISALWAAGISTFEDSLDDLWRMLDAWFPFQHTGRMLFAACSADQVEPLLEEAGGNEQAGIAIYAAPESVILGGSHEAMQQVYRRLREQNVLVQTLPYPPIHTPRLEQLRENLMPLLEQGRQFNPPRCEVYSAVHEAALPADPEQIHHTLWSNITRPVRFWQTLRKLHARGTRVFVQIGGGRMASSIATLLGNEDSLGVATELEHRHPVTQQQHMVGALFAANVPVDLAGLFAARQPRPLDLDHPAAASQPGPMAIDLTLYRPPVGPADAPRPQKAVPDDQPVTDQPIRAAGQCPDRQMPPPDAPSASAGSAAPSMPMVGRVTDHRPGEHITVVRRIDLAEDLYLHDHAFLRLTDVKPLCECMPVMPMTFMLEMVAEVAVHLAPGLGLIGYRHVRARRWIDLDGQTHRDIRVTARVLDRTDDGVTVSTQVTAGDEVLSTAEVRLGRRYRREQTWALPEPTQLHRLPCTAAQLYEQGHLFHGPRFARLADPLVRGDLCMFGHIRVTEPSGLFASTPTPTFLSDPVTLDAAGQLLGTYMLGSRFHVMPVAVDAIEFYQPPPAAGSVLPARVQFTRMDPEVRQLRGRIELQDGRGGVWARIEGWQDIMYQCSTQVLRCSRNPRAHTIGQARDFADLPGEVTVVRVDQSFLSDARLSWAARIYMTRAELGEYDQLAGSHRRQRQMLMSRCAVKDAVRIREARMETAEQMLHPARIEISHDDGGAPRVSFVQGLARRTPHVSLAHTDTTSVAAAADVPVGVDVESVANVEQIDASTFAGADELARLAAALGDGPKARTMLWCAKEAASKAAGTGLAGRPRDWSLISATSPATLTIEHRPTGHRYDVVARMDAAEVAIAVARVAASNPVPSPNADPAAAAR